MAMAHSSFEDIAIQLVETDRDRAKFQARDIAERLAQSGAHPAEGVSDGKNHVPYTEEEARQATYARQCLIKELLKKH